PGGDEGQIELPLGRLDVARGWWMKHDPAGQPAVTKWKLLGRSMGGGSIGDSRPSRYPPPQPSPSRGEGARSASSSAAYQFTWLGLEPMTGRTHQLRVHCAAMAWPILGDAIYGTASRNDGSMLHLHAREVVVPLYKNRAPIRVVAPIPAHMRAALTQCGWRDESQPRHFPPAFAREESQGVGS
ncbi:MAG: RNA pseudouridine synthase, partial [Xanthobacteraceae bacterium]